MDNNDQGLTVSVPGMAPYIAGFSAAGDPGPTGFGTNYFAPRTFFSFGPNSVLEGAVYLVTGDYKHARQVIYDLHNRLAPKDIFTPFGSVDNTGRETSFSESISGSTYSGTLTWNANGTLQKLVISDPFNAADSQTCIYLYDDLSRIGNRPGDSANQSVDCGSADWRQKFTYDPYGNLTKSGSITWLPGYDASTNRYTLAGTSYDANGDLLNDSFNSYTWDIDCHPVTVGSKALIYDALGRQVETTSGTTHTYKFYALGRMFALQGNTNNTFVPLPGGAAIVYSGTSILKYLVPDWEGS